MVEVLGVVQARGGSRGIPRKNLLDLGGHPLIAYSIASGLAAQSVNRLIVSTNDDEIAESARRYGAEVPFMRPDRLATDDAADLPLFEHALQTLDEEEGYRPDVVVQLRPTSPFRPRGLVDEAVRLLADDANADCVRGVSSPRQNPYKMWRQTRNGYLAPVIETDLDEPYNMPRQRLPKTFWQTGHIDAIRTSTILEKHTLTGSRVLPIHIEQRYCIDIDTVRDLEFAAALLQKGGLDIDRPAGDGWPEQVDVVVLDFDGVFTDNRVWVFEDGREAVACHRGDGMGLSLLRDAGVETAVLSTEVNSVVAARCEKLGIRCRHGLGHDKESAFRDLLEELGIAPGRVLYVGNDINDLTCMRMAGFSVAVADAHPLVLREADVVLSKRGGRGAIRELSDMIIMKSGGSFGQNG